MSVIYHALGLNLHQPPGNLWQLLETSPEEAKSILFAYDRIARFLWSHEDLARVHLSLSGSLLETLSDPQFQKAVYGTVDCGSMLWHLQNRQIIDILGTAFYHPVLPLIPREDWRAHVFNWKKLGGHLFWRDEFSGFWPPELGFTMELIPLLKAAGYSYVIVDSEHVEPVTSMTDAERRYRPHLARHDGIEMVVIVRDRELSNEIANGGCYGSFLAGLEHRLDGLVNPLVTTCTDGENGAWYRNTNTRENFWGGFYQGLLEDARDTGRIRPVFIPNYIREHGVFGEVTVHTGAWNTEWHDGKDFSQWAGGELQAKALERIRKVSLSMQSATKDAPQREIGDQEEQSMYLAYQRLLRAETSCNFYWGDTWVERANRDLDEAESTLARYQAKKYLMDTDAGWLLPDQRVS